MVIEHAAAFLAKQAGKAVIARIEGLTAEGRMAAAVAKSKDELLLQLGERIGHLEEAALTRAESREQFQLLFARLYAEGLFAASSERRRMIANALGGLIEFDDSAELQSRVARAVLELEPSDVALLRAYAKHAGFSGMGRLMHGSDSSHHALVGSRCIAEVQDSKAFAGELRRAERTGGSPKLPEPGFAVTALGHAVLKYFGEAKPSTRAEAVGAAPKE